MITLNNPLSYGGASSQAFNLCKALSRKGVSSFIVTEGSSMHHKQDRIEGINIYQLPTVARYNILRRVIFMILLFMYLIKWRNKYDIVHMHGISWASFPVTLASRIVKKKSVVKMSLNGSDDPLTLKRWGNYIFKFEWLTYNSLKMADIVVSISNDLSFSYKKSRLIDTKLVQVPNGVDTSLFKPVSPLRKSQIRESMLLPVNDKIIVFCGRLSFRKGIDILLTAWKVIIEKHSHCKLLLIGPKEDSCGYFHRPSEINLSNLNQQKLENINMIGHLKQTEVTNYLQAADIFILPSRQEGMPNTLLEAMACGLPCIGTNTSGIRDVIKHRHNGLLIENESIQNVVNSLYLLMTDDDLAKTLGDAALKCVIEEYSMSIVADSYINLYDSL